MQDLVFVNGPVQNGDFTFGQRPGKATGIRLTAALNQLLGNRPVPHLFNTVTLAGDRRHHGAQNGGVVPREEFEAALIAAKYDDGRLPDAGVITDTDPDVVRLALEMVEALLRRGTLNVRSERVPCCTGCGHMAGLGSRACKACGGSDLRVRTLRLLISDRPPGVPALDFADVHAHRRRAPLHLRNIADNAPDRLVLARTRAHGISLEPLGMGGLVLDPRGGLHITALATARDTTRDRRRGSFVASAAGARIKNLTGVASFSVLQVLCLPDAPLDGWLSYKVDGQPGAGGDPCLDQLSYFQSLRGDQSGPGEVCSLQAGVRQVRAKEAGGLGLRRVEVRTGQVGPRQVCIPQVRAAQVRAAEDRISQVRAAQIRAREVHALKVRSVQVRAGEGRPIQFGVPQDRMVHAGVSPLGPPFVFEWA